MISDIRRAVRSVVVGMLALVLSACAPSAVPSPTSASLAQPEQAPAKSEFERPELLMETAELAELMTEKRLRIVDLRAADKYVQGHIPGAVNLSPSDLDQKVNDVQDLAPPARVAQVLGDLGIGDETKVVLYDDQQTLLAGRAFWALDYLGHKDVVVLNGGFPKWAGERREITRVVPHVEKREFTPRPDPSKVADKAYVRANIGEKAVVFCDARSQGEYEGTDVRAKRGGHIPGAVNLNWEENLTAGETPIIKEAARLRQLYEQTGVSPDNEVITYCQTGARAAQAYYILRLLGYEKVRNYDSSWQQWGNDPSLPLDPQGDARSDGCG